MESKTRVVILAAFLAAASGCVAADVPEEEMGAAVKKSVKYKAPGK